MRPNGSSDPICLEGQAGWGSADGEPEEEGEMREQYLDGSKLPDYQVVRRYLGPGGFYIRSEDDGWSISGVLLTKEAE